MKFSYSAKCGGIDAIDENAWNDYVHAHPRGWWWHRSEWLKYQRAYTPFADDRSFMVLNRDKIECVVPLIVSHEKATMGGDPHILPLCDYSTEAFDVIDDMYGRVAMFNEQSQFRSLPGHAVEPNKTIPSRILNVSDPSIDHWRAMRKSYRSVVERARVTYNIVIGTDMQMMSDYRDVHTAAGGRRFQHPGSEDTYAMQAQWVDGGNAFLCVAYSRMKDYPVAASYVITYKRHAYWASGQSLDRDVQHAIQCAIIQHLVERDDIDTYELGWVPEYGGERGEKIKFFKSGFGGQGHDIGIYNVAPGDISRLASACEPVDSRSIAYTQ